MNFFRRVIENILNILENRGAIIQLDLFLSNSYLKNLYLINYIIGKSFSLAVSPENPTKIISDFCKSTT